MVSQYFTMDDVRSFGEPRGIVHIGGHTGEEAHNYVEFNDVVWIEAVPSFAEKMIERAESYGQIGIQALLSDEDGQQVPFHIASDEFASSMFIPGYHSIQNPHVSIIEVINLETIRFDTLWKQRGLDRLDVNMAIIDAQGSELLILKGMGEYLQRFDLIVAEYSTVPDFYVGGCSLHELDECLNEFQRVLPSTLQIHGDALWTRRAK